ncbi:MAG TPA: radical SAM protein [Sumerlaeia bacterium]|nr:radical SAM protein [Sumerlaeia bacterium]
MKITAKRLRLAMRSPAHLSWAVRHVLRGSPVGRLERYLPGGYALKPSLITVNVTGRCNLRCAMCMQPRGKEGAGGSTGDDDTATLRAGQSELTPEQWLRVVDQATWARPAFYFTGGEPLLYRGLDEILEGIKRRGMIAALVTNGSLLERQAERLVEIGVDNVTVSLDGPEEVHDRIRCVAGTFQRAVEGIRAVQEARRRASSRYPALKVNCVITPDSIDTLLETYAVVRRLGVEELNFQHPIFDSPENVARHNRVFAEALGDHRENGGQRHEDSPATQASKREGEFYDMRLSEEQFRRLEANLDAVLAETSPRPRVLFFPSVARRDWWGYYLDLGYPFQNRCTMPWRTMRLLADGAFEPCLHYVVGNPLDTPLWDLWNSPRMRRFRRALRRHDLFPACARCCYRDY